MGGQCQPPCLFTSAIPVLQDRVDPKADMDGYGNSRPSPMLDPRTVQTKAIPYTDSAIPVHNQYQHQGQEICSYVTQPKIHKLDVNFWCG